MKVYKITLYVSLIVFFILTAISVILNFYKDNDWVGFAINWCVGITCSIAVVIITTFIQFKVEQRKSIRKLILITYTLIYDNALFDSIFTNAVVRDSKTKTELDEFQRTWHNLIEKDMNEIRYVFSELEFFFKNLNFLKVLKISNSFTLSKYIKNENEPKEIESEYHRTTKALVDFADTITSFRVDCYGKDAIKEYVKEYRNKN